MSDGERVRVVIEVVLKTTARMSTKNEQAAGRISEYDYNSTVYDPVKNVGLI